MTDQAHGDGILSVSEVLVRTGRLLLDQSPVVLVAGVAASAVVVPAFYLLPRLPAALLCILALTEATSGAGYALHARSRGKRVRDAESGGLPRALLNGLFFAGVYAAAALVVWSAWSFYLANRGLPLLVLALFQSYVAAVLAASQIYAVALCTVSEMGAPRALAVGLKILLENRGYSARALLQLVAGTLVLAVTLLGLPLVWPGATAGYCISITTNVLGRYQ